MRMDIRQWEIKRCNEEGMERIVFLFFFLNFRTTNSFNVINILPYSDGRQVNDGQCVMYGECGDSYTGKLNCPYYGPPKPLKDQKAVETLKRFCPYLVKDNQPLTCCDVNQLRSFEQNFALAEQIFSRCRSCFLNFMALFCEMTCSPYQNDILATNTSTDQHTGRQVVTSVEYVVSRDYSDSMFASCSHVQLPSANEKAIAVLCGRPACSCTPQNWFDYMGDPANGHQPYTIYFKITNDVVFVQNKKIVPMNYTTIPCTDMCGCHDCITTKCPPSPKPRPCPNGSCFDGKIRPLFRQEQLVITRPHNNTEVRHQVPGPTVEYKNYTSIFDREFLHLVLKLQEKIFELTTHYNGENIQLRDICYTPLNTVDTGFRHKSRECRVTSVLGYWQSNHTTLDVVEMTPDGWFVKGDYLDHLDSCSKGDAVFDAYMNMTCESKTKERIQPNTVFAGYGGKNYNSSVALIITYFVNNYQDDRLNDMARAWESTFTDYIRNFSSPNMTVNSATAA